MKGTRKGSRKSNIRQRKSYSRKNKTMKGGAIYLRNQTCPECHGRNFLADCDTLFVFDCSRRNCDGSIEVNQHSNEGRMWLRNCANYTQGDAWHDGLGWVREPGYYMWRGQSFYE